MTRRTDRNGMLLIATIIAMVVVSVLGLAVVSLTSTSTYSRVVASQSNRAYYLAESGWGYALSRYKEDRTIISNGTFQLGGDGQFTLTGSGDSTSVVFTTIGIVDAGTGMEARRRLTYKFRHGLIGYNELDLGFANVAGEFDSASWNVDAGVVTIEASNQQTDNEPALNMKGSVAAISLSTNSEAHASLLTAWQQNNGLLSYDMQVKVKSQKDEEPYMEGMSFRFNAIAVTGYGVSVFRAEDITDFAPYIFQGFSALMDNRPYLVLWTQSGSTITELAYSQLEVPSGTVYSEIKTTGNATTTNWYLKDWSTIVLNLKEEYDGNGSRQNLISVYVQGTNVYPRNTEPSKWPPADPIFNLVTWNNNAQTITNSLYTSANFDTSPVAEIGIHSFHPHDQGTLQQFFDDFRIRVDFGTGGAGVVSPVVY